MEVVVFTVSRRRVRGKRQDEFVRGRLHDVSRATQVIYATSTRMQQQSAVL